MARCCLRTTVHFGQAILWVRRCNREMPLLCPRPHRRLAVGIGRRFFRRPSWQLRRQSLLRISILKSAVEMAVSTRARAVVFGLLCLLFFFCVAPSNLAAGLPQDPGTDAKAERKGPDEHGT